MDTQVGISLLMCFQTLLLAWYGYETWKIRKDANRQNELIAQQLLTMQSSLNRTISSEQFQADLQLSWTGGDGNYKKLLHRPIRCVNVGAEVEIMELRCSVPFSLVPRIFKVGQETVWEIGRNSRDVIYFGVRYKTRLAEVKEQVFSLEPGWYIPTLVKDQKLETLKNEDCI